MTARLGKVIYWTACGLVPLWIIGSVFGLEVSADVWPSVAISGAILIWAIGRAALYVLSGK